MATDPAISEKLLRRLLKERSLRLGNLTLSNALEAMVTFYLDAADFAVVPDGDGLVVYEDVTDYGRGTRLEVGISRIFRLAPADEGNHKWPAIRLRLRTCFKWDHAIVAEVLTEDTWCEVCWSRDGIAELKARTALHTAYRVLRDRVASEAAISFERTTYSPGNLRPAPEARQMWWGVRDVA
jgi:hypothetical protein